MKYPKLLILVGLSTAIIASEVDIPNTFVAGTPARAGEVNENFTAVEAAVNDNHTKITANEAALASNSSAISANSTAISANTNAIAAINETQSYIYPVNVASVNNAGYPNLRINSSGMYNSTDLTDIVFAPIVLRQGATVTDMYCLVRDNHNTANFSGGRILLMRVSLEEGMSPGIYEEIVDIDLTTAGSLAGLRRLNDEDGVVENAVIDNNQYMYYVRFWIQRTQAVSNLMVSGCRISYEA
ncbi:hypothetical protein [Pleionea mediterranea]|uniref:Uncharacterized protein n=1 Tax=Pleionea mediterranea TaxID=523701 RepID=A0A316FD96_9GAMM|nr:hypothetical protein [Pleionea mediterranea]PWK46379.1 hypothetical protein C8D97_11364 [Pleionea mediterranea]